LLAIASSISAASCAHSANVVDPNGEPMATDYSDGFDQSDAVAVLHNCHAPAGVLWVEATGDVRFVPSPNMDYKTSVCVLNELKASGTTKFGFVGNEKYVTPEKGE
jgi:hypothetical protein